MTSFVHKLTLLNRLLDATRECQTQYSTKKEIMTETNSFVSCVCRQFEDVLSHSMKQRPIVSGIATIQNVTGLQLVDQEVVFWHFVQKHLSKHEVDRFDNLGNIKTDVGKGRAWLRSSLNEHSLERVLQMILSDATGLQLYYNKDSFMLDEEKASLLPQIAGGLKSIVFSIKTDDAALNSVAPSANPGHKRGDSGGFSLPTFAQVSNILGHEVSMEDFPEASIYTSKTEAKKVTEKRRKKKARTKIINLNSPLNPASDGGSSFSSIDDRDTSRNRLRSHNASISSVDSTAIDIEQKHSHHRRKREESQESNASSEIAVGFEGPSLGDLHGSAEEVTGNERRKFGRDSGSRFVDYDIYKTSSAGSFDSLSPANLYSIGNEDVKAQNSDPLAELTANNSSMSTNISLSESVTDNKMAEQLESSFQLRFGSESETSSMNESAEIDEKSLVSSSSSNQLDIIQALNPENGSIRSGNMFTPPINDTDSIGSGSSLPNMSLLNIATKSSPSSFKPSSPSLPASEENTNETKNSELQKALVVLLQRKDELVAENKSIKELLEVEKQHSAHLKSENDQLRSQIADQDRLVKEDAQKQLRENDVLRNQLKKYVGAVHALQHGKSSPLVAQDGTSAVSNEASADKGQDSEIKMYEQKLTEVAEMHGELMEFTESLHTRFLSSLSLIHKMHDELVSLRGPMPTDDVIKAIEADKPRESMSSLPQLTRALVNVWVPSAFLQGTGPDSHHVYQIYICVGEDEWNVYRRYSDFHSLHTMLCKSYPEIQTFGFPPKKGIGNRNSKFVEERRKSFQKYLRLVMHNIFQNNSQLKAVPTKATLLHILPFFSDAGDQFRVLLGKNRK